MADPSDRTPPGDPWSIQLTYRHDQRWWYDANDEPEAWHVSADVYDDSGTHVDAHVGDMHIVAVDIYDTEDPFGLLDGEDADLGLVAEVIFDPAAGGLYPRLDEVLQPLGSRILILSAVRLAPAWRGFGLGVLLAGTALRKLSGGARAGVCYPAPLDDPATGEGFDEDIDRGGDHAEGLNDPVGRQRAVTALGEVWAQLGFEPFRDGVHVLDLNLVTLQENLARLRKRAERHRTYD